MEHYLTKRVYLGQNLVIRRERHVDNAGNGLGFTYTAEYLDSIGEGQTPDKARLDLMRGLVFDGKGDEKAVHCLWMFQVRYSHSRLRAVTAARAVEILKAEINGENPDWVRREYAPLLGRVTC